MTKLLWNVQVGDNYADDQSDLFETEAQAREAAQEFAADPRNDGDEIRITSLTIDENGEALTQSKEVIRDGNH